MKSNLIIFFTNNPDNNSELIRLLESISTLSICSYDSHNWDEVDLYSQKIVAFVFDGLNDNGSFPWIVTKLSEDGVFADIPALFTNDDCLHAFEDMGYSACAVDVLPSNFRTDIVLRRVENLIEIHRLKRQMNKMSSIHTKRILDQANMLKEQNSKMNSMNYELIELLVAAIESRDMESGQHIKRIKYFTKALTDVVMKRCPEYNISQTQADYIFLASSVHDIGKIAIPDAIMLKPGRLTKAEFEIMKTHTTQGAQLLDMLDEIGDVQYSKYCRDICLYHHERWDGRGYPEGLKGDEIPISAQIVSVADCYDALTSERPYKGVLSHEEAANLILTGACGTFSAHLLDCFKEALPEFDRIEKELKAASEEKEKTPSVISIPYQVAQFSNEHIYEAEYQLSKDEEEEKLKISICEDMLLSAYNVIFEANLIENDFQVVRGSWSPLFPFLPKNIYEAFAQCHKICHPKDAARFLQNISMSSFKELVKKGIMKTRVEFRAQKGDVEYVILGMLAFEANEEKEITKVFGAFDAYFEDDIEKEIQRSYTISDGLTGIPLQKKFQKEVDDFLRVLPNSKNALLFIDIDEMNMINSLFGYEYGNTFIKDIAGKLREIKDTNDIYIGKGSADKFFVFVKNVSQSKDLIMLIDKLHKTLRRSYNTQNGVDEFTVSMGVAMYPQDGKNFIELFNNAEFASKAAKLNRKSSYAFFNPSMKDFAKLTADITDIKFSLDNSYKFAFFPVLSRKTGELVCYDFNPFAGSITQIAFSSDFYNAVNKSEANVKDFSLLSIKNLLLTLIEKRDLGMKIPPISVYTLLVPDDIPSFVQNLNDFVSNNDCTDIDITLNIPQDFLEKCSMRELNSFATALKALGFSLGIYLVGERYIHNNCYIDAIFRRVVLAPTFMDTALMSKTATKYAVETLNNFKFVADYVSMPMKVIDSDAEKFFSMGCTDFTHTIEDLSGFDSMLEDYKNRKDAVIEPAKETPFISEMNQTMLLHDFKNSGIVMISYDSTTAKLQASENINDVLGFDVQAYFENSSRDFIEKFVYSEDIDEFFLAIAKAKATIKPVMFTARCIADDTFNTFKTYNVTIQCILNSLGLPARYHCLLIPQD